MEQSAKQGFLGDRIAFILVYIVIHHILVAPIGFMEVRMDDLLPVSGAGLDFL